MNYKQIELDEIDSTNSYLKRNWNTLDDMTFVFANFQTNGYGRFDRKWESNAKDNLLFSLLIKDKKILSNAELLPTVFPYIIYTLLTHNKINDITVKWPNDIYVKDKKICGMIFESQLPYYLIVGVGLNVNQKSNLPETATSVSKELGTNVKISDIKGEIINLTIGCLENLDAASKNVNEFYLKNNYLLNKKIEFEYNHKTYIGIVKNIDSLNRLIVDIGDSILSLNSGEVRLIKK